MHFTGRNRIIGSMKSISLSLLLCLSLLGASLSARAQESDKAFEAVVSVEDRTDASRRAGLRKALNVVLRRVVGGSYNSTGQILNRASELVQQYQFLPDPDREGVQFRAVFDPDAVKKAAKRLGLPVFGLDPSLVDAWIVDVRGLQSANDYSRVFRLFKELAGVRRLEVAQLVDDRVRLRMIVEGGIERANLLVLSAGLLQQEGEGAYVYARN